MTKPYLYLLRLTGSDLYKIGVSAKPWRRLKQIAGSVHSVDVVRVWPGLAPFEKRLHSRWAHNRIADADLPTSGQTEWFRLTEEDVDTIRADCYCELLQAQERERIKQRVRLT